VTSVELVGDVSDGAGEDGEPDWGEVLPRRGEDHHAAVRVVEVAVVFLVELVDDVPSAAMKVFSPGWMGSRLTGSAVWIRSSCPVRNCLMRL